MTIGRPATKAELIAALYNSGHSRQLCPLWFKQMLAHINEARN